MKSSIIVLSFLLIFFSCETKNSIEIALKNNFETTLNSWGFNTQVSFNNKDTKVFNVLFKDKETFFYDSLSNKLLLKLLIESQYRYLKENVKEDIIIKFNFEDFPDKYEIRLTNSKLISNHDFFANEINYNLVVHSVKKIRYKGTLEFNALLKFLDKEDNDFHFDGNFWTLLSDYSKACKDPKEHLKSLLLFSALIGVITDDENESNYDFTDEDMYYYLEHCGFERKLAKMSFSELMKYLDLKYYHTP